MKHIKTTSGFEIDLDEECVQDMEFVDLLAGMDDGSINAAFGMSRICTILLGKTGKKALYDHLRNEKGRVPAEKVDVEVTEILNLLGAEDTNTKN